MKDLNGFSVSAPIEKKLGRLLEVEDDESEEEDGESDSPKREKEVSPSHVTRFGTAGVSGLNGATRREWFSIGAVATGVKWDEAIGNSTANDDTDGLEDRKGCQQETAILIPVNRCQSLSVVVECTCGRNSNVMVVSIGIFPPTPNPTKAVNTRMPL